MIKNVTSYFLTFVFGFAVGSITLYGFYKIPIVKQSELSLSKKCEQDAMIFLARERQAIRYGFVGWLGTHYNQLNNACYIEIVKDQAQGVYGHYQIFNVWDGKYPSAKTVKLIDGKFFKDPDWKEYEKIRMELFELKHF